jgi:ubiquinone/menaquinone biosynthesis C-methylase UbiE
LLSRRKVSESGSGALETYLAKYKVPNGKVTAVDVSDEMVKQNLQLAKNTQTRNIFPVVGSAQRLPVRANSQDVVLAINLPLADREAVAQLLQTVHRVIKRGPDSRLVLIKGITRQDQETQELRIMERAGFERVHVERYGVFNQIVMFETLKLREKEK